MSQKYNRKWRLLRGRFFSAKTKTVNRNIMSQKYNRKLASSERKVLPSIKENC
jgi:hypothetical protein